MPTTLPQLDADLFLCDGGLETTLVFLEGMDLPDFASFPLLDTDDGRAALRAYFEPSFELAVRHRRLALDTPTWRANPDWGAGLGYDREALADVNRRSVEFIRALADAHSDVVTVVNGVVGPRGDGYVVGETMTAEEAADYHSLQAQAFADAGADMMSSVTMTYTAEAIGTVVAAERAGLPVVVSFTVETDGSLPMRRRSSTGATSPTWPTATSLCGPPSRTCGWSAGAAAPTSSTSPASPPRSPDRS